MNYDDFCRAVDYDDHGHMWRYTIKVDGVEYFTQMYTHTVDKEHYKRQFFNNVNEALEKRVKKAFDSDVAHEDKASNG